MPGKSTEGYTKAAQRKKFVRHRDIKLSGKELDRESHILQKACENVCRRCREKVQWRFQYDKYKPLSAVATCQRCRRKCVTKAYRALCEGCSSREQVCESCCKPYLKDAAGNATDETSAKRVDGVYSEGDFDEDTEDDGRVLDEARRAAIFRSVCGGGAAAAAARPSEDGMDASGRVDVAVDEADNDEGDDQDDDDQEDEGNVLGVVDEDGIEDSFNSTKLDAVTEQKLVWDESRFAHYAASKYSKTRVVGSGTELELEDAVADIL